MALACNLGKGNRTVRVIIGVVMIVAGVVFLRSSWPAAALFGVAGTIVLVEGALGH